jgi:hypothetical protein
MRPPVLESEAVADGAAVVEAEAFGALEVDGAAAFEADGTVLRPDLV